MPGKNGKTPEFIDFGSAKSDRAFMTDEERRMIDDLDGLDRPVTTWEGSFLDSMVSMADRNKAAPITENQRRTLQDMAEKYLD